MSEDPNFELTQLPFAEVLAALKDEEHPFPAKYLYRLSGLEEEDLAQLRQLWPGLSSNRRLAILEDSELLAESNTVMQFDSLNRLGLDDADADVRVVAIRSLWQSEKPDLAPIFIKLLDEDEDVAVRAQAAAALGRFIYLGELGKIPTALLKQVEQRLLETARDETLNLLIQRRALESLGYSSREEVAELIEDAYESGEEDWLSSALFAMGRSADDRWAPMVIERLQDSNNEVSREAARAAGELELEDAADELIGLLEHDDSEVRLAAAWSLSQIGGAGIADALQDALERTEDQDEIDLFEDALENLAFTQELGELNILDFSPDDLESFAHPDRENGLPEEDEDLE